MGNYAESASHGNWGTNVFDSIINRLSAPDGTVSFSPGCLDISCDSTLGFAAASKVAQAADTVIVFLGLDFSGGAADESEGHDRKAIELPGNQVALVQSLRLAAPHAKIVAVLVHGGTLNLGAAAGDLDSIMSAWYPGLEGGPAVAETLFGDSSPAGRTAVTWYSNTSVLPLPGEMDESKGYGTTYRYIKDDSIVTYPFGFGLSYTTFECKYYQCFCRRLCPTNIQFPSNTVQKLCH